MIVNDEARQARVAQARKRDDTLQANFNNVTREIKDAGLIDKTNTLLQMGKMMLTPDFEQKLFPLNKGFVAETFPHDSSKRALYIVDLRGKFHVMSYESAWMPERSVMTHKTVRVPDPKLSSMSGRDVPSSDPDALKPGWMDVQIPGREAVRGWRTVLARLIQNDLITLSDSDRVFGGDNTPEWQQNTGAAGYTRPW